MATMTIRTTVAFDLATASRLERLSKRWGVSKSETLRRALETAEKAQPVVPSHSPDFARMTPLQILDWVAANPQVPAEWGDDFRRELAEARARDVQIEEERANQRNTVTDSLSKS